MLVWEEREVDVKLRGGKGVYELLSEEREVDVKLRGGKGGYVVMGGKGGRCKVKRGERRICCYGRKGR